MRLIKLNGINYTVDPGNVIRKWNESAWDYVIESRLSDADVAYIRKYAM